MSSHGRPQRLVLAVLGLLAACAGVAILAGCGGGDEEATTATGETAAAKSSPSCRQAEEPRPSRASYEAPKQTVTEGERLTVVVETNCGSFEIELDAERAPKTVNSFAFLARNGFYEGRALDRVIQPGTLLLGGEPGAGRSDAGYTIVEPPPKDLAYTKGTVAMVKGTEEPPGYSGSQFFIVLSPDAELPPEYALVGKVDEGLDVVERIGEISTGPEQQRQTIAIEKIQVKAAGGGGGSTSEASGSGCEQVEAPKRSDGNYEAPKQTVTESEKLTAVVETNCGSFEIALDAKRAPKTVNSFVFLSEEGFYDGLTFDQASPTFIVQGGDPLGRGNGGPGYSVDEKPPRGIDYGVGDVAMGQLSPPDVPPGHSGSEFFIIVGPAVELFPVYAPLGKVDKGFDVVKRIARLGGAGDKPKQTVLIESISIERS